MCVCAFVLVTIFERREGGRRGGSEGGKEERRKGGSLRGSKVRTGMYGNVVYPLAGVHAQGEHLFLITVK